MASISVVIPAYNVDQYICEAVNSVLLQTLLPSEIIIINDGSTDNTSSILKKYEDHERIRVIHTKNRGLGEARNRGLEESCSEYIYFFDSDDVLELNFIYRIQEYINTNNSPDIILFSGQSFLDEQCSVTSFMPNYDRKLNCSLSNNYDLISKLMNNDVFFSSACLYVSKKSVWRNNKLKFKSIIHEDEEIIFMILALSKTSLITTDVFFNRRVRNDSIMTRGKGLKNLYGLMVSLQSMYDFKKENRALCQELLFFWKKRVELFSIKILFLMKDLKNPVINLTFIRSLFYVITFKRIAKLSKLIFKKVFFIKNSK